MAWVIETRFSYGWDVVGSSEYETEAEAQADLEEHFENMLYAYEHGFIKGKPERDVWRVVEYD